MNNVSLIGRLTRDPETVTTKNDTQICTLRIAVDRRGQDGAVFTDVKAFGKQAGACQEHLAKGRQVAVSGRLELDEWQSESGEKRSRLYVIGERVEFLARPRASENSAAPEPVAAASGDGDGEDIPF